MLHCINLIQYLAILASYPHGCLLWKLLKMPLMMHGLLACAHMGVLQKCMFTAIQISPLRMHIFLNIVFKFLECLLGSSMPWTTCIVYDAGLISAMLLLVFALV